MAPDSPAGPGAGWIQRRSQDGLPADGVNGHQGEHSRLRFHHGNVSSCFLVGAEELMLQQDKQHSLCRRRQIKITQSDSRSSHQRLNNAHAVGVASETGGVGEPVSKVNPLQQLPGL